MKCFFVILEILNQCGQSPADEPEVDVGQTPCLFAGSTQGSFFFQCYYPGEFSPLRFCEAEILQLLGGVDNSFIGSGITWPDAANLLSQGLPAIIATLTADPSLVLWQGVLSMISGLVQLGLASSVFSSLSPPAIASAVCDIIWGNQEMHIKVVDEPAKAIDLGVISSAPPNPIIATISIFQSGLDCDSLTESPSADPTTPAPIPSGSGPSGSEPTEPGDPGSTSIGLGVRLCRDLRHQLPLLGIYIHPDGNHGSHDDYPDVDHHGHHDHHV